MTDAWYNYAVVYTFATATSNGTGRAFLNRNVPLDTAAELEAAEQAIAREGM